MSSKIASQFQNTNYSFTISAADHDNIDFRIQQFTGLGLTLGNMELHHFGATRKYPGDSVTVNPLSLTVVLDEKLYALEEIYNHMHELKNIETNEQDPEYLFTGVLQMYDSLNYPVLRIKFQNCWISSMGDVTLNSAESDNTNLVVDITVECDYFEYERVE